MKTSMMMSLPMTKMRTKLKDSLRSMVKPKKVKERTGLPTERLSETPSLPDPMLSMPKRKRMPESKPLFVVNFTKRAKLELDKSTQHHSPTQLSHTESESTKMRTMPRRLRLKCTLTELTNSREL